MRTAGVQVELGADAEGDDRLPEGEDDDQVVPFGEVAGHEPPAVGAEDGGHAPVDQHGEEPQTICPAPST